MGKYIVTLQPGKQKYSYQFMQDIVDDFLYGDLQKYNTISVFSIEFETWLLYNCDKKYIRELKKGGFFSGF